jgi:hypothetical protein
MPATWAAPHHTHAPDHGGETFVEGSDLLDARVGLREGG